MLSYHSVIIWLCCGIDAWLDWSMRISIYYYILPLLYAYIIVLLYWYILRLWYSQIHIILCYHLSTRRCVLISAKRITAKPPYMGLGGGRVHALSGGAAVSGPGRAHGSPPAGRVCPARAWAHKVALRWCALLKSTHKALLQSPGACPGISYSVVFEYSF